MVKLNGEHCKSLMKHLNRTDIVGCGITQRDGIECFMVLVNGDVAGIPETFTVENELVGIVAKGGVGWAKAL